MASASSSLRRRALPIAMALAVVAAIGLLTDTVASAQVVALAGPSALSAVFAVSGVLLGLSTLLQFSTIDQRPRLTSVRIINVALGLGSAMALAWVILGAAPALAISVLWLLGDQIQLLIPAVLWSLAGDVFTADEGRRVYGWILAWTYGAQVAGLLVAAVSPVFVDGTALVGLLAINPVGTLLIGLLLPRAMRGSGASAGQAQGESIRQALAGALSFLRHVPAWRAIAVAAVISATAGVLARLGATGAAAAIIGPDPDRLQLFIASVTLAVLVLCLAFQFTVSARVTRRLSTPARLVVLPLATVVGGLALALGSAETQLALLAASAIAVGVPTLTIDDASREEALTLVPDQVRARVTLIIEFGRFTLAQVVAGGLALIGVSTGWFWVTGLLVAILGALALPWAVTARREWSTDLLNWRLKRRKRMGIPAWLDVDDQE